MRNESSYCFKTTYKYITLSSLEPLRPDVPVPKSFRPSWRRSGRTPAGSRWRLSRTPCWRNGSSFFVFSDVFDHKTFSFCINFLLISNIFKYFWFFVYTATQLVLLPPHVPWIGRESGILLLRYSMICIIYWHCNFLLSFTVLFNDENWDRFRITFDQCRKCSTIVNYST